MIHLDIVKAGCHIHCVAGRTERKTERVASAAHAAPLYTIHGLLDILPLCRIAAIDALLHRNSTRIFIACTDTSARPQLLARTLTALLSHGVSVRWHLEAHTPLLSRIQRTSTAAQLLGS
jgi:hypothetical protein